VLFRARRGVSEPTADASFLGSGSLASKRTDELAQSIDVGVLVGGR